MSELQYAIENIIPIMHETENGSLDLDAKQLAAEYPAPMKKLIEVFGAVSEEHKLHIHIEERPYLLVEIDFKSTKPQYIPVQPIPEYYHITWHKKEGPCGVWG